jgi:hypothetical protein
VARFNDKNPVTVDSSSDLAKSGTSLNSNDTRWKTIAGASRLCEM